MSAELGEGGVAEEMGMALSEATIRGAVANARALASSPISEVDQVSIELGAASGWSVTLMRLHIAAAEIGQLEAFARILIEAGRVAQGELL